MNTGKIVVVDDEKIVTSAFSTLLKVEEFSDAHFFELIKSALVPKWSEGCFIEKWLKNSNVNTRCLKQRRF